MSAVDDVRVKPHVRAAAKEVQDRFGITNIGGFATTGHISNSDHYKGLAIDVMGSLRGQEIANWLQANAKRLSITYLIWNRQIWDSRDGKGWVAYHGTSPHTDHVHASFSPTPGDGSSPIETADPSNNQGCLGAFLNLFNPLK